VSAQFAINQYTLMYRAGDNGSVEGASPQTVIHGRDGSAIKAAPAAGHHFVSWSDGSTGNPRTDRKVRSDVAVTANFAINRYTLTYTAGEGGSIGGASSQTVNHGSDASVVTALPAAGYHFEGWSDGVSAASRTESKVTADAAVMARFAINRYTLTYAAGDNGSIDGASPQIVNHGGDASAVTAVPVVGHHFEGWSDGVADAGRTERNVTADAAVASRIRGAPTSSMASCIVSAVPRPIP
jgi:hypothetical protein